MKIRKVGQLNDNNEVSGRLPGRILALLSIDESNRELSTVITFPMFIGQGSAARMLKLEVPVNTEILNAQLTDPVSLTPEEPFRLHEGEYAAVFMFRDQIFLVECAYLANTTAEEAILLIKKQVFLDDNRLKKLRQEVEAIERVIEQIGIKRIAIPETVKLVVYARDEGKCVRCGSNQKLHFDHVIPVAKGGGNSENNIQLLCDYCNLQKSDKIAF